MLWREPKQLPILPRLRQIYFLEAFQISFKWKYFLAIFLSFSALSQLYLEMLENEKFWSHIRKICSLNREKTRRKSLRCGELRYDVSLSLWSSSISRILNFYSVLARLVFTHVWWEFRRRRGQMFPNPNYDLLFWCKKKGENELERGEHKIYNKRRHWVSVLFWAWELWALSDWRK